MAIDENGRFAHRMNDPMGGAPTAAGFSDEQFAELRRLLHPIHHLARLHLKERGHVENEDGSWRDPKTEGATGATGSAESATGASGATGAGATGEAGATGATGLTEHAPDRDPLDAPEDRDPDKMPAEEPQREFHASVAEPSYEDRTVHTSAEMDKDADRRGEEPEFGGTNMEQAELHRQNDLLKGRPNQGQDQASLTGGESMVQRNLAETQARNVDAGPEVEGGAAADKDKAAAEGGPIVQQPKPPAKPAATGPSTVAKDPNTVN